MSTGLGTRPIVSLVVAGVGLAGLAVGGIFGVMTILFLTSHRAGPRAAAAGWMVQPSVGPREGGMLVRSEF